MTGPTYDQIMEIMHRTMAEVTAAGHDLRLCVWELSPSILLTLEESLRGRQYIDLRHASGGVRAFHGIPIRRGVEDESTGILLKMVNQNPNE